MEETQGKILRSGLLPQFLTNGHETWHIDWSWREDVQDIFWGCMENFVAMVAAYLSQKFKKNIVHGITSLVFTSCHKTWHTRWSS